MTHDMIRGAHRSDEQARAAASLLWAMATAPTRGAFVSNDSARPRAWREPIEAGLLRLHRVACPSSSDHRPGRRCGCDGWQFQIGGRTTTIHGTRDDA
jgi:hypothetical protein